MQYEIYSAHIPEANKKVEWRWRLVKLSTNKAISISADAFTNREDCEKSIHFNMMADYKTSIVTIEEKNKKGYFGICK